MYQVNSSSRLWRYSKDVDNSWFNMSTLCSHIRQPEYEIPCNKTAWWAFVPVMHRSKARNMYVSCPMAKFSIGDVPVCDPGQNCPRWFGNVAYGEENVQQLAFDLASRGPHQCRQTTLATPWRYQPGGKAYLAPAASINSSREEAVPDPIKANFCVDDLTPRMI
ncbi:hypothetical protein LTR78_001387 [Recurvomyces mirabilis]|uniref:Uncharacterized protein n=1 Tax=Recurvomyces mirabilis TaxID=574656 RepID=A0AAE0WW42_9PEZI|nr:hypothetical protein LTR78_001387 [Recurvomyces mirabilis]KAK5161364.1 hypothetical protein LTS14_001160 [Recurvomyces mirabilis]